MLQGTEAGTDKKGAGPDLPDFRTRAPEPLPADLAPGSLWLNQEETELAYLLEVPELSVSLFTLLRLPRGRRQTDFLVQAREDQTHARQILAYRKLKRVKPVMSSVLKFELKEEDTSRRLFLSGDGSPRKILILGTEFEVTAAHQPASSFRPLGYSRSGRFFFLRLVDGEEQTRSIVAAQVVAEPSGTNSPAASTAP